MEDVMLEMQYDFDTKIQQIIKNNHYSPRRVYNILSDQNAVISAGELSQRILQELLFSAVKVANNSNSEGVERQRCLIKLVALNAVRRFLLKFAYEEYDSSDDDSAGKYMYITFMWMTGCTKEQSKILVDGLMQFKDIHDCLFDNLFSRNINLRNCSSITVESDGITEAVIIRAVRDDKNYDISKYCDYMLNPMSHEHTMIINMHN